MLSEPDVFGVVGVAEDGIVFVDPSFVEMDHWSHPFTRRTAYCWLLTRSRPVPARYRSLAGTWQWTAAEARKFIYRMAGAGLVRFVGKTIVAVPLADAVPCAIEGSWTALRAFVLARDGYACVYCGSPNDLHCDHVIPRSRGGVDHPDNLVAACSPCNLSKGASTPDEWRGRVA